MSSGRGISLAQMSAGARIGLVLAPIALIWAAIWALVH
jgi:hypothetical protein